MGIVNDTNAAARDAQAAVYEQKDAIAAFVERAGIEPREGDLNTFVLMRARLEGLEAEALRLASIAIKAR